MSYKSRQKKRKYRTAERRQQDSARSGKGPGQAGRHYLTVVRRDCCCNEPTCGRSLRKGAECVYRHEPREIICLECADRRQIRYRTSRSWEASRKKRRKRSSGSAGRDPSPSEWQFGADLLERVRAINPP